MANYGPFIKQGVKLAAKYGPQAKLAWDAAGPTVKKAAATQAETMSNRKKAFAKAGTLKNGAVWSLRHHDQRVYVVLADRVPVESFPAVDTPLDELVRDADPAKIVTHAEWLETRAAARAKRAAAAVARKAPGSKS